MNLQGYYKGERVAIQDTSYTGDVTQYLVMNEDGERMWVFDHDPHFEITERDTLPLSYFPLEGDN